MGVAVVVVIANAFSAAHSLSLCVHNSISKPKNVCMPAITAINFYMCLGYSKSTKGLNG